MFALRKIFKKHQFKIRRLILVLKKREKKSNITRLFLITIHWTTHHSLISNTSKWNPSTRSIFHVLQPCERKNFFFIPDSFFYHSQTTIEKKQHFNTTFLTLKDHLIKWWTNQKKKRNIEQNQEVLGPKKNKKKNMEKFAIVGNTNEKKCENKMNIQELIV